MIKKHRTYSSEKLGVDQSKKVKVGVYARVSTDDQEKSIENQHAIYNSWIEKNNAELYDVYTDEGISGTKGKKRHEWQRILKDGREKKYDVFLVKSFSRFGRNQRETLEAVKELIEAGIRIIFLEDNLDSKKDTANFGLFAWLAEQEARRTSERIKYIWSQYNDEGKVHVCTPPYGYDYNHVTKNFDINPVESMIISKIFDWYLNGYGINKIARMLMKENVPTKKGGQWAGTTITGIIHNDFYIGTLTQGMTRSLDVTMEAREIIPSDKWERHLNHHPSIIADDIFYKAQVIAGERQQMAEGVYSEDVKKKKATRQSNVSLYSNLLKCGMCGSSMSVKRTKKYNYEPHYNCIAYMIKGKDICGHTSNFIWEDTLSNILKQELVELVKDNYTKVKTLINANKNLVKSANKTVELELKDIKTRIDSNMKMSMTLLSNKEKGLIGDTQYKMQNEIIENNLNTLLDRRKKLEQMPKEDNRAIIENELIQNIDNVLTLAEKEWTNAQLKTIIDSIVIDNSGNIVFNIRYLNSKDSNICAYRIS